MHDHPSEAIARSGTQVQGSRGWGGEMTPDKQDVGLDRSTGLFRLRDYTRALGERIASLRRRASGDATSEVLIEAFQELEITREELAVAGEEISSAEARFEEALRVLEARVRHYSALFDGAPDGHALTDALGVVREGNRTLGTMLGVPKRFLEGKPLVNFVARGDVRTYRDWLGTLLSGESQSTATPLRMRPRHGEPVFVAEVLAGVVRGVGDRVTSIRWSLRKAHAPAALLVEAPLPSGSDPGR
jgi:PAS domain S-box-containing protein